DGTFFSATDADSPSPDGRREEGAFFTWTPRELTSALGEDDARAAMDWFGVTAAGNFEGRNVLTTEGRELTMKPAVQARLPRIRARLLEVRSHRPPPLRDEKSVVAWNGLAVSAFARAAVVLGEPRYERAALSAARALVAPLRAGRPLPHELVGG